MMIKKLTIKAGGIVINKEGELCVISRKSMGDLSLPKGCLEAGETIEQCALREVKEETGWDCAISQYVGAMSYTYMNKEIEVHSYVFFYLMNLVSYSPDDIATEEISKIARIKLSKSGISKLTHLSDRNFIRQTLFNESV